MPTPLDVMSRYGPARVQHNSLFPSSTSRTTSPRSTPKLSPMSDASGSPKTLTPQRKHHKLLKDGSEVWSDDVEKIFVEGLKEYWESPWATYSRGRSRWRNQFLVDHLKKYGIERSKKQVASHIQVLRNMWRGEPEFHLVAGGEELFMENGLLASPKASTSASATPDPPESSSQYDSLEDLSSSSASTPDSMTPDFNPPISPAISIPQLPPSGGTMGLLSSNFGAFPSRSAPSALDLSYGTSSSPPRHHTQGAVKLEPLHGTRGLFDLSPVAQGPFSGVIDLAPPFQLATTPRYGVTSFSLWAEGMAPFTIDIDRLTRATMTSGNPQQSELSSILLRIKLSISSIDDIHSSPNLHGFQGAISFSERWNSEAKCITKTYTGPACVTQEIGYLGGVNPAPGLSNTILSSQAVTAVLPESPLSRCKWLETSQDTITQQIIIDGVVLAAFVFHLERTVVAGSPPSAELVGFQRYKPSSRRRNLSQQISLSSPTSPETTIPAQYFSSPTSAAYSGAGLSPGSTLLPRHPMDSPMSCALPSTRNPGAYSHAKLPSRNPAHGVFFPQP